VTKLTVDPDLRTKFANFQELLELCDESGRVLGFFHRTTTNKTALPISDGEIEITRKQRTGRPLADIPADLNQQG
jgi:hypothetical protein